MTPIWLPVVPLLLPAELYCAYEDGLLLLSTLVSFYLKVLPDIAPEYMVLVGDLVMLDLPASMVFKLDDTLLL